MRKDKQKAIALRKKGNSYAQINKILGVPKSTLSYWLKDTKLSESAKKKVSNRVYEKSIKALIRRNIKQTQVAQEKAEKIQKQSKVEVLKLKSNRLFIIGVCLYWAEGYKKGAYGSKWKGVDFANSDPEMINIMMTFFRKICKVKEDKFKIQIIAHKNVNFHKAIQYWSKVTSISKNQFFKTSYSINSKSKRKNNTLPHGTIHIRINNVELFHKIIGWIEGIKEINYNRSVA